MVTETDPSDLRAQLQAAFANADKDAAERLQHLQWVHEARAARLSRTAAELKAEHGGDDPAVKRAEADAAAARSAGARLSAARQQMATAEPDVAPDGWALHGRVFSTDMKPVRGFSVFVVNAAKAYQDKYGFAYTDESGYFLLNYAGPAEPSKTTPPGKDTAPGELFVAVGDLQGRPVFLDTTTPFTPVPGAAVYQNIFLSRVDPLGQRPRGAKKAAAPKRKPKT